MAVWECLATDCRWSGFHGACETAKRGDDRPVFLCPTCKTAVTVRPAGAESCSACNKVRCVCRVLAEDRQRPGQRELPLGGGV